MKKQSQPRKVPKRSSQKKSQPALPRNVVLLQKRLRNHIISQFEFTSKMDTKKDADFSRRANKVNDFQERIISAGLKAIGISHDELVRRQEIDMASARKGAKRRRKELIKKSQKLALAHKHKTKRMQALRQRFEKEVGNPRLSVFLCERVAEHFFARPERSSDAVSIHISDLQYIKEVGKNITRWRLKIGHTNREFGRYHGIFMNEFVWNSDREGILDAEALIYLNGVYDIDLIGKCIGFSSAYLRLTPYMYVSQNVSGSTDIILWSTANNSNYLLDINRRAECVGRVDDGMATPLDTGEVSISRSNFPLQANKPIIVTMVITVDAFAYNGATLDLDFLSDQSFAIDVPCVALIVDS